VLHHTWHGDLHVVLALIGFIAAPLGAILIARAFFRNPAMEAVARASMVLAASSLAALLAMRPLANHHLGGLGERIFIAAVLAWTVHAAVYLRRALSKAPKRPLPSQSG